MTLQIGQALRILEVHGYHMNLSSRVTDQHYLIRCQNVWWTVYVLERQISVLMGAPLSINDNDISASLPSFPDSPLKTAAAAIHVKLSQAFGQVVNGKASMSTLHLTMDPNSLVALYRESGHRRSTLVKSAQGVLQKVANVAPDLREYFPVPEQESMNGISRVTGYMNLLYHQCVMLATRPFLFILVEMCANSEEPLRDVPTPVKLLLQICLESAKETIFILSALQDQTLLECFLPFHLESAVSAGLVFTMASLASPSLIESHTYYLGPLSSVLDQIIEQGNLIAAGQKKELNQLESLCASLKVSPAMGDYAVSSQLQEGAIPATGLTSGPLEPIGNDHGQNPNQAWTGQFGEPSQSAINMSPTQLLEVVDMMNGDSLLDWLDLPATALEFGNEGH
ncbi:hypothetical protein PHISCL_02565 [Aspergillus sclerotialis]|uniref:Xylanolytic transcriptional activator regulatory domain-containing protein n=1 Tax=Aspergillus sclerotialis TaxID=2070753 RepID=A0A3A3A0C4_9EURO|nr:hypothetical protein PHISCL_02565 [Aspergillus sclerotialis]